jgi:hypothetical protein
MGRAAKGIGERADQRVLGALVPWLGRRLGRPAAVDAHTIDWSARHYGHQHRAGPPRLRDSGMQGREVPQTAADSYHYSVNARRAHTHE